jgi:hypothetical protein
MSPPPLHPAVRPLPNMLQGVTAGVPLILREVADVLADSLVHLDRLLIASERCTNIQDNVSHSETIDA